MPAPLMPPPTTTTSNLSLEGLAASRSRSIRARHRSIGIATILASAPRNEARENTRRHRDGREEAPPARARPGHVELARHRVRRRAAPSVAHGAAASSARSFRSPAGSSTIRWRSGRAQLATACEARSRRPSVDADRTSRLDRHHQPARDDHRLEPRRPASRSATPSSGRTGAPQPECEALKQRGLEPLFREQAPGSVLDAYFSGTKVAWLLDHTSRARAPRPKRGELAFGTVDSWLDVAAHRRRRHGVVA